MAGLYIHIPFCKKRCLYCDFFSTTLLERREEYVEALIREIQARKHEADEPIRTIYLGGGTPSTLDIQDIQRLLAAIDTPEAEEITMELNPGDATPEYLHLSGRRHNAAQAIDTVHRAQEAGFDNLSIDLMYALPTQTTNQWQADIETALRLGIQHISCYGLMYEEGTAMTRMRDQGELTPIDEDTENAMYDYLCARLRDAGFAHYEVSNFALPGFASKHNSRYWDGTPYIGVGAGAHSYIGNIRSWNPDDLDAYLRGIQDGNLVRESEALTDQDVYNERIMLGLRTCQGVPRKAIQTDLSAYIAKGLLRETNEGNIVATQRGIHILNRIIEDLMI